MNNPAYQSEILDYDQVMAYQKNHGILPEAKVISISDPPVTDVQKLIDKDELDRAMLEGGFMRRMKVKREQQRRRQAR